jgi:hypothetical protein
VKQDGGKRVVDTQTAEIVIDVDTSVVDQSQVSESKPGSPVGWLGHPVKCPNSPSTISSFNAVNPDVSPSATICIGIQVFEIEPAIGISYNIVKNPATYRRQDVFFDHVLSDQRESFRGTG